jgi:hypothetical protein
MTKWLIPIGVLLVLGASLWMTHHEGIVLSFGAGLATGCIIMVLRQRSKA